MATSCFQDPGRDCAACPRLVAFRETYRTAEPEWWNAPVPSFGGLDAPLLILGLAPGLQGANRTGRPFTGDWAGDLLYATLSDLGLAQGIYAKTPDDGLSLMHCRIANAVRCVPPQNKPNGAEMAACRAFLAKEIGAMPNLRAIFTLGRIAHEAALRVLGQKPSAYKFVHAKRHDIAIAGRSGGIAVVNSYHCSRYNTNTGRLTADMFHNALQLAKEAADIR